MVWGRGSHSSRHVRVLKDLLWVKSIASQVWAQISPTSSCGTLSKSIPGESQPSICKTGVPPPGSPRSRD